MTMILQTKTKMKVNFTQVWYFTLSAYLDLGSCTYFIFILVLNMYVLIIGCNVVLIVVICMNRSLHEPMYMFLCSLFVNELYGSTGLFPFLLIQILSDVHTVSAPLCFLQVFCLYSYGSVEFLTLAVMSYDRYVAICFPLQYNTVMTSKKTVRLVVIMWFYPFFSIAILLSLSVGLPLCGNIINKIYCHNSSIMKLSCFNVTFNNVYGIVNAFFLLFFPAVLIFYTYISIIKVCFSGSKQTRQKAVSTCTPHLVSLLNFSFGSFLEVLESRLNMSSFPNMLQVVGQSSLVYIISCQTLFNPLLYGLKMTKIRRKLDLCLIKTETMFKCNRVSYIEIV
ncbi:olfactory receptor 10J4 [Austrofundulus limnaeus]|uniref:Olfactory receptor n=1 Tax=Austrofundulus limnaeus TaxID=52670 RepID=A0A2I4C8E0_AUSLI|nr:PREDICTED: olfactory receptor 10J4-like [Austrofundulus limnaeus]